MGQTSKINAIKNIKKLRKKLKLSLEELSLLAGLDNSYVGKLERENINLKIDTLDKIADFFQVSTSDIIKEEMPKTKTKRLKRVDYENNDIRKIVGWNISKYRLKKGYSKEELSGKLGFSESYIRKAEAGLLNITLDKIAQIANMLEIQVIDLFK